MIRFFINRPIFSTVIAIIIVVAGLATVRSLPIAQYPDITPPTVMVSAVYPGASAQTVAQTIGVPIEQQVNGVDGMIYMSSSSSSNGSYSLTVTFEVGTDIDMATVLVQNRVNAAQGNLPQVVLQQGVTTQKQSTDIVMFLSLSSDNPRYDALYLSNYAELNLVDELSRLPGIGSVSVFGIGDYSMRIWMDPEKMRIRGLEPADIYAAIYNQNKEISAGGVGIPPVRGAADYQFTLSMKGRLNNVEDFENIVLRTLSNGSYLRLRDVATVEIGSETYNVTSTQNGKPTAAVAIYQLPGSNALTVANAVKKEMEKLSAYFPADLKYDIVLDTTQFVKASIREIVKTFLETLLLVVLVILLFLQSFRAMLIPTIVIPISIIGTFAVMKVMGFSINTLSLFGLVLAIAIVVDDAIVVVENATRFISQGKYSRREAVYRAMQEITGPVIGVVLVLSAVFIPTAFTGGITGQLYKQFALTIATATVFSGFISLVFTPAMSALFLKKEDPSRKFFLFRWFNKFYAWVQDLYVKIITKLLAHSVITFVVFILITALTVFLFMKIPSSFVPEEDQGYFMVSVQLPPAASLERTIAVTNQVGRILSGYPQVETYLTINGFSMMGGGSQPNGGTVFVMLKNWKERPGKANSAFSLVNKFNQEAAAIQEAQIFAVSPPGIPGLGESGGLQVEIEDRNNYGPGELQDAVDQLMASYRQMPELVMLNTQYQANTPQYFLNINRDKVDMMGISVADVFTTLSYYMGSAYVNDFIEFGRIYQVKIEADAASRSFIDDVLKLSVKNANGEMVPFSAFIVPVEQVGTNNITRYNMYTAASVIAIVNPAYSTQQGIDAMQELIQNTLGNNYGYEWTSVAYQQTKAGTSVSGIFILSFIIVILVLAAQYESWTSPIAVLMGVPFAILGAVVGTVLMRLSISVYSQIGIILLIALSAKNAILIVEFARDYRAAGKSIVESAIEAGRVRLRPILMTSFAFIFGVLPLMFATGAGAQSRIYLGTAVVFGMFFNTVFGTLFVPNFYHTMQTLQEKFTRKRGDDPADSVNSTASAGSSQPAGTLSASGETTYTPDEGKLSRRDY